MQSSEGNAQGDQIFGLNLFCKGCGGCRNSGVGDGMCYTRHPLSGHWSAREMNSEPGIYFRLQKALEDGGGVAITTEGWVTIYLCSQCNQDETTLREVEDSIGSEVLKSPIVFEKLHQCALLGKQRTDLRRQLEPIEQGLAIAKRELQEAMDICVPRGSKAPKVL